MTPYTTDSTGPTLSPMAQAGHTLKQGWRIAQGRARTAWRPATVWLGAPLTALQDPIVVADALGRLEAWCAQHPGQVCELGLSAAWLLTCVVPPGWSLQAAQQHALNQWGHYHDLDTQALSNHWVVRHVADPQANVFCAVPRALIDGLMALAARHHVRWAWVGPWWVRGVQACLAGWERPQAECEARSLTLHEGDLTLCVQARSDAQGRWTLAQVQWALSDAPLCADAQADAKPLSVSLPAELMAPLGSATVSDHPALRGLLSGRSVAWKGAA